MAISPEHRCTTVRGDARCVRLVNHDGWHVMRDGFDEPATVGAVYWRDGKHCGLPHPGTGGPCIVPTGLFHREHSDGSMLWDTDDEPEPVTRESLALDMGRDVLANGLVPFLTRLVGAANTVRLIREATGRATGPIGADTDDEPEPLSWERGPLCDLATTVDKLTLRVRELEERLSPVTR